MWIKLIYDLDQIDLLTDEIDVDGFDTGLEWPASLDKTIIKLNWYFEIENLGEFGIEQCVVTCKGMMTKKAEF